VPLSNLFVLFFLKVRDIGRLPPANPGKEAIWAGGSPPTPNGFWEPKRTPDLHRESITLPTSQLFILPVLQNKVRTSGLLSPS